MPRKIQTEDLCETVVCNHTDSVIEVSQILRDTQSRHLLVLDDNETPIGVISVVDINNRIVAEEKNPSELKATDIMTKDLITITCDTELSSAVETMSEKNISSLPVVDKDKKLLGALEFSKSLQCLCEAEKELIKND